MTMPHNEMKVLAVIPARGGSKGVPRKNIKPFGGKPLLSWSIEAALKSRYIDRVVVSTEDEEIAQTALAWGADVPFRRPAELAQDHSSGSEPVLHAMEQLPEYDVIVLLQPTSPLRTSEDIDGCLERMAASGSSSCISLTVPDKSPYWMYEIASASELKPILTPPGSAKLRQELPPVYVLNGAVYCATREHLLANGQYMLPGRTVGYLMPKERSLDIDNPVDFIIGEYWLEHKE